jgi:hypothetical protein
VSRADALMLGTPMARNGHIAGLADHVIIHHYLSQS